MNTKFKLSIAATLVIVACSASFAVLEFPDIGSPKDCPDGLIIRTQTKYSMIEFDVLVDSARVGHVPKLYQGRVKSSLWLNISDGERQITSVEVKGTNVAAQDYYQFRISPLTAKTSNFQLMLRLYEKDGTPTLGGETTARVHLKGFEPKPEEEKKPKQKN